MPINPFKSLREYITKERKIIMSALSDYATRQNARLDALDAGLADITGDIAGLKALIEQLQNNPGPISPEDQALLDQLESRLATLSGKAEALAASTPNTPPPVEPPVEG